MNSLLRDTSRNIDISGYASWLRSSTPTMITNTALDGTTYIQLVGEPLVEYKVTAYVNREQKDMLDASAQNCSLMLCRTSKGTVYGRITDKIKYGDRLAGDYFKAELTLTEET